KDEILAIALQKLGLMPGDIFADIGCGTGKVTLAAASQVTRVHAIDIREEAYRWTEGEVKRCNASNVILYHDDAAMVLASLERLDTAFVGGSRNLGVIVRELARLQVRSLVITAVLLTTLHTAIESLTGYGMFREVIHVQVSKSVLIAGGIMLKPIDPVYIIHGGASSC
ncbi:MAG: methyltransferase domain-containing protein, partial [Methanospirillum sp.]|nr:methyltransferase domain-containing protein [Methanospirillum sp.]